MDVARTVNPRPEAALAHWNRQDDVRLSPDNGLINLTWLVGDPPNAVLQWVNPIFDPRIHVAIDAVTRRLESSGFETPLVIPTAGGRLWAENEDGVWRLQTYVEGSTLHRLAGPTQAMRAGRLVGRFHAALVDWSEPFPAPPRRIHDTPVRMAQLRAALEACDGHHLEGEARQTGGEILRLWQAWDGELDLPEHVCHGDLKISNVRFDTAGERAVCLIDFDTLEPMPYASELGDAWRSWCNPAGEDEPEASRLDVELFAASARAWLQAAPALEPRELDSLVPGIERIVLELAARFTADAVRNDYFRENRERFPEPGRHNLVRGQSQLRLVRSVQAQRLACEAILRDALPA